MSKNAKWLVSRTGKPQTDGCLRSHPPFFVLYPCCFIKQSLGKSIVDMALDRNIKENQWWISQPSLMTRLNRHFLCQFPTTNPKKWPVLLNIGIPKSPWVSILEKWWWLDTGWLGGPCQDFGQNPPAAWGPGWQKPHPLVKLFKHHRDQRTRGWFLVNKSFFMKIITIFTIFRERFVLLAPFLIAILTEPDGQRTGKWPSSIGKNPLFLWPCSMAKSTI